MRRVLRHGWHHSVIYVACWTMFGACSISPVGQLAPKDSSAWAQCGSATKVHLKAPESTVTVSYTEPTAGTDGKPLENLDRTTIYVDAGGFLDASFRYDFNDNLQVRASVSNVLDTKEKAFMQLNEQGQTAPRFAFLNDRRVVLGLRYQF